jgi:hypothetical protein
MKALPPSLLPSLPGQTIAGKAAAATLGRQGSTDTGSPP